MSPLRHRLAALAIFGVAMGVFEAILVIYIREMLGIDRSQTIPPYDDVMARLHSIPWLLRTEQLREAATIVMLAAVGWLCAPSLRGRFGAFIAVFGLWDLVYYATLRVLIGFPATLGTLDLLFLIPPGPWWYQPVWVPMLLATGMVGAGTWLMREGRPRGG